MSKKPINPRDHAFHFEASLKAFAKSGSGCFVRLEIHPDELPPELPEARIGQRFLCVLTPMPDDMGEPSSRELTDGERAIRAAGIMCKDGDFQDFIGANSEVEAAAELRKRLGIESRTELKVNRRAREAFWKLHNEFDDVRSGL